MPRPKSNKIEMCKCRYCGKEIEKQSAYSPQKSMYYCNENHYLSALENKKNKGNHSYKSAEGSDRRDYTDYLLQCYLDEGFDKKFPQWQILMSQTNNILNNNKNWSYESIKYIIYYQKEILGLQLITKESNYSPLSLVEFYGQEAERYYNECCEIEQSIDDFELNDNAKVIKKYNNYKQNKKNKIIDINEL